MAVRRNPLVKPSEFVRTVARALCVVQALGTMPIAATQADGKPAQEPTKPNAASQPKTESVRANRTVPNVAPPPSELTLTAYPSNEELTRARIFSEPLVPMNRATMRDENAALARAILTYRDSKRSERVAPLLTFLSRYPDSAWRPSLMANLGTVYRANGYLSKALAAWEEAWNAASTASDPRGRGVADYALGEWLDLSSKIGHADEIEARLDEIKTRDVTGRATQKVGMAREALWVFKYHHEFALPSGPTALQIILASGAHEKKAAFPPNATLQSYHASATGTSLTELKELANKADLEYEMAYRQPGTNFPVPSVIHWRVDHYSALVKEEGGRFLLIDPAIGGTQWVTREMLNEEASGYFLAKKKDIESSTSRVVAIAEGSTVIGHCLPGAPYDADPTPMCGAGGGGGGGGGGGNGPCGCGMPQYVLLQMPASLRLIDNPLTYRPAVGPELVFRLTYNQRDSEQPQIFSSSNVGPKWTFDWLSWVTDDPTSQDVQASVSLRGGGAEHYTGSLVNGAYPAYWQTRAVLAKTSSTPIRYERRLPDGGVEVFAQSDGTITSGRRVFLTDVVDPQGLSLHFTYDLSLRLVAVTDATGLVTTLSYELTQDPLKVTEVTDPYGRSASLSYNSNGQLATITDALGLVSSFVYAAEDFVSSLTTPYGMTLFTHETDQAHTTSFRFVQATDPVGGTERVEFRWLTTDVASTEPSNQVPSGFSAYNHDLDHYNSFYWDKRAMAVGPGAASTATISHWLLWNYESFGLIYYLHGFSVSTPHSVKRPVENRVWYAYPDQTSAGASVGSGSQPTRTARVLDDGTSQIFQATYNSQGRPTSQTDPLGRTTTFTYASNGIDLLQTRQGSDVFSSFSNYTGLHQPQTAVDAAAQTTTTTYNAFGQPLTLTNAKGELTLLAYDANHHLETATQPLGAITTLTYDGFGRIRTQTGPDGYTITTDYDVFDRVIRTTYPDGTFDALTYDRLDLAAKTDRLGRTTRFFYDPMRRLVATRDPAGRTITQQWCKCGSLDKLVDANGNATSWDRDVQARVTRELRADGTTATLYTYESTTSRVKNVTDPKGQVTNYTYLVDNALQQINFTNAEHPTPSVSYTYDGIYKRVATMVDGTGTTAYTYKAAGVVGALQLASVDGPLTNDTITYDYDELGRVVGRAVNSVGLTQSYDALGRVTSETSVLGTFGTTYVGAMGRVDQITYPSGQTLTYTYYPNSGDNRLQSLHYTRPGGATLSKFDYTYDTAGNILTWIQQADSESPTVYAYRYDRADQLTGAVQTSADLATTLKRYAYVYDAAGNRMTEQIEDNVMQSSYDVLNRQLSQQAGGSLRVAGQLSEPASVDINGKPASVSADNKFEGTVSAVAGTNTFSVTARDGNGNQQTNVYQSTNSGATRTLTYDPNGNLVSDGTRTFEWDARNQLLAVTVGTHRSEFTYDGLNRRVRQVEKENSSIQSDTRVLWCETVLCEERSADGSTVIRRAFAQGEQVGGNARYFAADQLGSVHEVTDAAGNLMARYAFDPWGKRTLTSGTDITAVGFTGHYEHAASGLTLTQFRAFDSNTGRWISADPSGFVDGPNLYTYVGNSPLSRVDPFGLACQEIFRIYLGTTSRSSFTPEGLPTLLLVNVLVGGTGAPFMRPPVSVVTCFWRQLVTKTTFWTSHWFGVFQCSNGCDKWRETEFYTEVAITKEGPFEHSITDQFVMPLTENSAMAYSRCKERMLQSMGLR
jgi:RHS repeat-associated protein